jgi:hypothetical protein
MHLRKSFKSVLSLPNGGIIDGIIASLPVSVLA